MSNEKILPFSREQEQINTENLVAMFKFLDDWEMKDGERGQIIRMAESEQRRQKEFSLKTDGEIIAIVNRGTPETWAEDPWRYNAARFELRRRGYLVDATT